MTKGQYIRLFLGSDNTTAPAKVIGAAKQLTLHISCTVEVATTKDTVGDWDVQEVTEISYDISSNALVRSGDIITSLVNANGLSDLETIYEAGNPVKWQIANVSGANNRTKGAVICSGSCIVSQLSINAPNRQTADYTATLNGVGQIVVGA
jgi:predicted secreted protein